MMKQVENWIDRVLKDATVPADVVAFCFNLYEESEGGWAMELVGTQRFDPEDQDWACDEVTDFGSRENLYSWDAECEWEQALEYMVNALKQYLSCGKYADLLKSGQAVGVGFVDGDIEILHRK